VDKIFPFIGWGFGKQLGRLELKLLRELWSRGSATVRELLENDDANLAYTTIMTTMDRLYKKELLDRVVEGRAYRYFPRHTPDEMRRVAAVEGIRQLFGSGDASSLPLSYLVEALSEQDTQLLDELQVLVERKRRELRKQEQS
jgi:predicted transcriptional regulator